MSTHQGSCHCGAVTFEVEWTPSEVMMCNCSICGRMGWRLAFVGAEKFTLKSGEDALTDYQFGVKKTHHPFCTHCGIRSFGHGVAPDGSTNYAVNVRCLEGIDAESLPSQTFDGASL